MKKANQYEIHPISTGAGKSKAFYSFQIVSLFKHYVLSDLKLSFHRKMSNCFKTTYIYYRPENSSRPSKVKKKICDKHENNPTMNIMSPVQPHPGKYRSWVSSWNITLSYKPEHENFYEDCIQCK